MFNNKKETHDWYSALGSLMRAFKLLVEAVLRHGGTLDDINRLDKKESEGLLDAIGKMIAEAGKNLSPFPIWKIVKRDTALRTADDFRRAFKEKGIRVGDWANDILGRIPIASDGAEFNLVIATTKELTGKDCASTAEVFAGAASKNLEKCPADIGPLLRDQYKDQPNGEWLLIGMEPISDSDEDLGVFRVKRVDDGLWLLGGYGFPDLFWHGDRRWVFVRKSR